MRQSPFIYYQKHTKQIKTIANNMKTKSNKPKDYTIELLIICLILAALGSLI